MNAIAGNSLGERFLRTAFFQHGVENAGWFEKMLITIYSVFSQLTLCPKLFDRERAERGLHSFVNLGAKAQFVVPSDRQASVHMMSLKAKDIKDRIERAGGLWQKIKIQDADGQERSILAILPPENCNTNWCALEDDLRRLWKKKNVVVDGIEREVIVTCEFADVLKEDDYHSKLFLHSNSAGVVSMMLTKRAAFYLGCMQDICFFDPRGVWKSRGIASEGGYYNDIKAVYDEISEQYNPENIWVTSACGGCPSAASLKTRVSRRVNFIFESAFTKLADFRPGRFDRWCLRRYQKGVLSQDIEDAKKPKETSFGMEQLWEEHGFSDLGKVIVVSPVNDDRLDPHVSQKVEDLVRRVNEHVLVVGFESEAKSTHGDRYFKYIRPSALVCEYIFRKI
ncbi:MAG: hypothetical protein P4L16_03050 [Chlamydiales bacterium]|nr:hypothetical protein [Chlamydiales bacterium]